MESPRPLSLPARPVTPPSRPIRRGTSLVLLLAALLAALLAGPACLWKDGRAEPLADAGAATTAPPMNVAELALNPLPVPRHLSDPEADAAIVALRRAVRDALAAADLAGSSHSLYAVSLTRGDVLLSFEQDALMRPASSLKLLTTAAALDVLGPDFTFRTPVYLAGGIQGDEILDGAVLVVGHGDPSISSRYRPGGGTTDAILDQWAKAVWDAGVRYVVEGVVIDDSLFPGPQYNPWWEMEDLGMSYAAPVSPLAINENCVDVIVTPAENVGEPAQVTLHPDNALFTLDAEVATAEAGAGELVTVDRAPGSPVIRVRGAVARDHGPYRAWRAVDDGTEWSAHLVARALERRGITLAEPPRRVSAMSESERAEFLARPRRRVHEQVSRPLFELIAIVNKASQNLYAEMLLRALGAQDGGVGSIATGGEVLSGFLARTGANVSGLAVADGSGLSWRNLTTTRQLVQVLRRMERHPAATIYYNSLPIAGVDGTLETRMTGGATFGNVHAKTGYINKTRSIAGYVTARGGERIAFAFLANDYATSTPRINGLHDRLCALLADFAR